MIDVQGNIEKVTQKCNELQENQKVKGKKKKKKRENNSQLPFLNFNIDIPNKNYLR